jgi:hypothetical protein
LAGPHSSGRENPLFKEAVGGRKTEGIYNNIIKMDLDTLYSVSVFQIFQILLSFNQYPQTPSQVFYVRKNRCYPKSFIRSGLVGTHDENNKVNKSPVGLLFSVSKKE